MPQFLKTALACLGRAYRLGYAYKKAGVVLLNLLPEEVERQYLFEAPPRNGDLMRVMDEINRKYGRGRRMSGEARGDGYGR